MDRAALQLQWQMESAVRHLREQVWGWRPLRPFEDAGDDSAEPSAQARPLGGRTSG